MTKNTGYIVQFSVTAERITYSWSFIEYSEMHLFILFCLGERSVKNFKSIPMEPESRKYGWWFALKSLFDLDS